MEEYIPDLYKKSIYAINYDNLLERGIKTIIFNISNTILTPQNVEPTNKLINHFECLKNLGFKLILITNINKKIASLIKENLQTSLYTYNNHLKDKDILNLLKSNKLLEPEVALVSNDIVYDIKAANEAGITTILVNPMSNHKSLFKMFYYNKEKKIMNDLRNKELFKKGKYYE